MMQNQTKDLLLQVLLSERIEQSQDVISLTFSPLDGGQMPAFEAGAHIDLHLGNGLIRQYSIASDPADLSHYRLGILKDPTSRGGSSYAHETLNVGDVVSIGWPRSNFPLNEKAGGSILIAGGIGITPMLAMALRLEALGKDYRLHYCTRTQDRVSFRDLLDRAPLQDHLTLHLSHGDSDQHFMFSEDVGLPDDDTHIYICGPDRLINHVLDEADRFGWPADRIHYEHFSATVKPEEGDQPITIIAAKSGLTIEVASDQTIAQALGEAGIDIALACEQGICGTCVTYVLEGTPLHRDDYLSASEKAEGKSITVCCSRAKTACLKLDI